MRTCFLVALLVGYGAPLFAQNAAPEVDDFYIHPTAPKGPAAVDAAYKPAVMAKMEQIARDPTSLIYDWGDPPHQGWIDLRGTPRYDGLIGCARVKGKNGFGGYGNWMKIYYVVTASGEAAIMQTWDDGLPPVGKYISHDPGCPR